MYFYDFFSITVSFFEIPVDQWFREMSFSIIRAPYKDKGVSCHRLKPYCDPEVPNSLLTFDHLTGVRMRDKLHLASEAGLKEAFLGLIGVGGDQQQSMDETATR